MEDHTPDERAPAWDPETEAAWQDWRPRITPQHQDAAWKLYMDDPDAFLVYLDHYYMDEHPEDIRADLESIFFGSYDTREAWAQEVIEVLGWDAALRQALQAASIPEEAVAWRPEVLLEHAASMGFRFYSRGGRIHVFAE